MILACSALVHESNEMKGEKKKNEGKQRKKQKKKDEFRSLRKLLEGFFPHKINIELCLPKDYFLQKLLFLFYIIERYEISQGKLHFITFNVLNLMEKENEVENEERKIRKKKKRKDDSVQGTSSAFIKNHFQSMFTFMVAQFSVSAF